jgi:hypothetical protein
MMEALAGDEAGRGKTQKIRSSKRRDNTKANIEEKGRTLSDPKISILSLEDTEIKDAQGKDGNGQEVNQSLRAKGQRFQEEDPSHGDLYQTFEGTGLRAKSNGRVGYGLLSQGMLA